MSDFQDWIIVVRSRPDKLCVMCSQVLHVFCWLSNIHIKFSQVSDKLTFHILALSDSIEFLFSISALTFYITWIWKQHWHLFPTNFHNSSVSNLRSLLPHTLKLFCRLRPYVRHITAPRVNFLVTFLVHMRNHTFVSLRTVWIKVLSQGGIVAWR